MLEIISMFMFPPEPISEGSIPLPIRAHSGKGRSFAMVHLAFYQQKSMDGVTP